jgi:sterol desaturase/sphingolipid hydroxylase (fatty acid hydroxylase superfamily)
MSWEEGNVVVGEGLTPAVPAVIAGSVAAEDAKAWRDVLLGIAAATLVAAVVVVALRYLPTISVRFGGVWKRLHEEYWLLLFASPVFYAASAGILLLEKFYPADREQPLLSVSLAQDFVWIFFEAVMKVTVLVAFSALIRAVIRRKLGFAILGVWADWPVWSRWVMAVLAADFLGWFHHFVRHKVHVFWLFHTVHHSQKHLNMFTDFRYHVVEYVVANTIRVSVMTVLNFGHPEIVLYVLAHEWYARFYHANIRTNLGWLRYILVTPQSHRVHHSPEPRHWDKNFGVIFSIWDRMFGTQYKGSDEYPRTGVPYEDFPHEHSARVGSLLWTPLVQMAYPFRALVRGTRSERREARSE